MVILVPGSVDQAGRNGTIYQLNSTVATQEQVVGCLANRRTAGVAVPADREEQLVLGGGQAGSACLLLAPAQEAAQACPQRQ